MNDDTAIRVFLVDDQMLVRAGFRMLIDAQDDMRVVGEAADGAAAVEALTADRSAGRLSAPVAADVVLMDVRMPVMDGVRATERIATVPPTGTSPTGGPKVLVLTTFDLDEYVYSALRAGASGFLLKDARPDDLLGAIRSVAAGDAVVAPSATRRLINSVLHTLPGAPRADAARLDVLTTREREVLQLVAAGRTNSEIAAGLFMAEATVKTHIGHLLAKLEIRDRVGLVVLAYETGLASG